MERCLIQQRQGQDLKLSPFVLQRLGDSRFNQKIGILDNMRGISQERIPTDLIVPSRDPIYASKYFWSIQTFGTIKFPNPQDLRFSKYEGIPVSTIMLGRVIEDLDRPSKTYYDSEVASLLEGDVWGVKSAQQPLRLLEPRLSLRYSTKAGEPRGIRRSLTTEGINTYRSLLNIKDTVPEFLKSSEKKDLAKWVSEREAGKAAFIITAYQTYTNAIIKNDVIYWQNEQIRRRLLEKIPGSRQKASLEEEGKCSHHYEVDHESVRLT